MPRAIVTRPAQEAQRWVSDLQARGIDAVALPLICIAAAADPAPVRRAWHRLTHYDAVMFVSGNAVRHFFALRPLHSSQAFDPERSPLRAWVSGPGSCDALLACGAKAGAIDAPAPSGGQFDSEALWQQVQSQCASGLRLLIVRGGVADAAQTAQGAGRDWLAQRVLAAGGGVDFVVAYERRAPVWGAQDAARIATAATDGSVWIFSSAEAVGYLRTSLPQQNWSHARALVTHARMAQAVRQLGFAEVLESRPVLEDVAASIAAASGRD